MVSSNESLRQNLGFFLRGMEKRRAHWYRCFIPAPSERNRDVIMATFPALSTLLGIDDNVMQELMCRASLARKWGGDVLPDHKALDVFWIEYQLDVETAICQLKESKRHLYIEDHAWSCASTAHLIAGAEIFCSSSACTL